MQEVILPESTLAIITAILQVVGGIMAVIALTGLGKLAAEKLGWSPTANQVRFASGVAAVIVCVVAGLAGGSIPGVGPMPTTGVPADWVTWLASASLPLMLFANAVWKYVYRPEPEGPVPAPTGASRL
jgi:quinol-cytochrome oxidoreductase complex cytochrome b subunit